MGGKIDVPMLCRHWIHSHEEDTESEVVYRPSHYGFPPARGRKGLEVCENGTCVEYVVGQGDRPVGKQRRWKLVGDQMALYAELGDEPIVMLTISAVDGEKLVLRKGGQCKT